MADGGVKSQMVNGIEMFFFPNVVRGQREEVSQEATQDSHRRL